jgi:transcriptional regulator with XRE-family HTH domain
MDFAGLLHILGQNIRRARWAKGLTQQEVAAHGLSFRYFQELERGQRNPTLRTLAELAEILGTTVAALVETEPGEQVRKRRTLAELPATAPKRGRKSRKTT